MANINAENTTAHLTPAIFCINVYMFFLNIISSTNGPANTIYKVFNTTTSLN